MHAEDILKIELSAEPAKPPLITCGHCKRPVKAAWRLDRLELAVCCQPLSYVWHQPPTIDPSCTVTCEAT